jgi:signal transduction histidine kinase
VQSAHGGQRGQDGRNGKRLRGGASEAAPETPESIAAALASQDAVRLQKAIEAATERARNEPPEARVVFFEQILPLVDHAEANVRQAVAGATDLLGDAAFDRVLPRLSADDDPFVREAMKRAAKRRAVRRVVRAKEAEQEKVIAEMLDGIERRYDRDARRLTERTVRRGTEYFVRKLHHETSKVTTPLAYALNRIRAEIRKPHADHATLTQHVEVASQRLDLLVSLLDRARDATEMITPSFADVPLLALVDDARAHLTDRLGPRAARLVFTVDVAPAITLDADRGALLQALQNFLQNAVEAYPPEASRFEIAITARMLRGGSQVELTVGDSGVGMTEEKLATRFIPFSSTKPGGAGMGMTIARTMIEEVHGGTLTLQTARGVGTKVILLLPARQTRHTQPPQVRGP